jgi:hypothetical protein
MGVKITGLNEFRRSLQTLSRRAQNLSGPVEFDDLFPPEFMRRYTDFKTVDEMFAGFDPPILTEEDFKNAPDDKWNDFVQARTKFVSWEAMQAKAGEEYVERRLNLENL